MTTYIALLRGINVGGKNILPMKELCALLEKLDLKNIRTYIQSGNCIFDIAEANTTALAELIADNIEQNFGFRPKVLILLKSNLEAALSANPFPESANDPKNIHLYFLSEPAGNADLAALEKIKKTSERFKLVDQVF